MSVPFTIRSGGRRFEGRYRVDGHHLEITTAYGARRAALGLERPVKFAKALYRVILRDIVSSTMVDSAVMAEIAANDAAHADAMRPSAAN